MQTPDQQWHLDRKVPLTIIFAILMQASAVIWAISDIKKDVEILKAQMTNQHERDERQDKQTAEAVALVRSDIKDVSQKLDRLFEKKRGE